MKNPFGAALLFIIGLSACARGARFVPDAEGSGGAGGGTDALPDAPAAICERYVGCVADSDPDALAVASSIFGPGAACWSSGIAEAHACRDACRRAALAMPGCGECDEDAACGATGEACVEHVCAPRGCRIEVRGLDATIERACACEADCSAETRFLNELATSARAAACGDAFDAWAACEATELACDAGHVDVYAACTAELDALTACVNEHRDAWCPASKEGARVR